MLHRDVFFVVTYSSSRVWPRWFCKIPSTVLYVYYYSEFGKKIAKYYKNILKIIKIKYDVIHMTIHTMLEYNRIVA